MSDFARRLEMLTELAAARANLVEAGALSLHDAVDGLQLLAEQWGLVDAIGQDEVQRLIAAPFRLLELQEAA